MSTPGDSTGNVIVGRVVETTDLVEPNATNTRVYVPVTYSQNGSGHASQWIHVPKYTEKQENGERIVTLVSATTIKDPSDITVKDIKAFFGMTLVEMKNEWVKMPEKDKEDIKRGLADGSLTY